MGLMGAIADGYWKATPVIDARRQLATENARADEKQQMWLAQQQRQQDMYDAALKEKAANRILAANPGYMKGYQDFVGPLSPDRQQALDYATPGILQQSVNYKTDAEKLQEFLQKYQAQKIIDATYRPAEKPGTDVLSLFKRVHNRMPNDDKELFTFAQGLKGKSGQNIELYDADGNKIFSMGALPTGMTTGAKTALQKDHQGVTGLLDTIDPLVASIDPKYFNWGTQKLMDVTKSAEKTPVIGNFVPDSLRENLADYSSAMSGMGKQLIDAVRAASGAQVTDKEREFIKTEYALSGEDSESSAVGKLVNLYNTLGRADARYRALTALNNNIPPTKEQVEAWENSVDPAKRDTLLRLYGFKEFTQDDIRKKMGSKFRKNASPTTPPAVAPQVAPVDAQARTKAWLDYANE